MTNIIIIIIITEKAEDIHKNKQMTFIFNKPNTNEKSVGQIDAEAHKHEDKRACNCFGITTNYLVK